MDGIILTLIEEMQTYIEWIDDNLFPIDEVCENGTIHYYSSGEFEQDLLTEEEIEIAVLELIKKDSKK